MSIDQIIPLAGIVSAFVLFAAWGDYTIQHAMALKKEDKRAAAASGAIKARWPQPSDSRLQHAT
jgi:hypothetical protein